MPQRGSLLPYRGVQSFLSKAREASGSETPRVHHAARRRGGGVAARGACAAGRARTARRRAHAHELTSPKLRPYIAAFLQGLQEAGWAVGRNLRIDYRWSGSDRSRLSQHATELISLGPDVVLPASAGPRCAAGDQHTVPIVFAQVIDPVGTGAVASLARPGGNVTGFTQFEYTLSAKWLELLGKSRPA